MFEFRDDAVKFVDERVGASFAEYIYQGTVIPESALLAAAEAVEHGVAFNAVVGENFAGVGQFVSGGDEPDVGEFVRDLFDVGALSFAPIPFLARGFVRIRAAIDDARDAFAEFLTDFVETWETALVFNGIVQKRGDHFILAAAVLNDDGSDAKQVAYIRLAFALAALVQVQFRRIAKRFHKTVCENGLFDDGLSVVQLFRLPAAHLAEQAEDFEIEPDERDHQAERAVPFHVFRRTTLNASLDHVEIEHQV